MLCFLWHHISVKKASVNDGLYESPKVGHTKFDNINWGFSKLQHCLVVFYTHSKVGTRTHSRWHTCIWVCVKTCSDNLGHACEKLNWVYHFENLTKYSPPFQQYSPSVRKIILSTQMKILLNEYVLPKCNGCNTRHISSLLCNYNKQSDTDCFLTTFVFKH